MSAGEICNRMVVVTYRSVALSEAARVMREHHVGSLVVVEETDAGRLPVGMLTDRDIVVSVVAKDLDARNLAVVDAMSAEPVTVREGDSMFDALRLMRQRGVRRVPVTGDKGQLVGIVTVDDVLEIIAEEMGDLVRAISNEQRQESRRRE